jgi:hypothetical protein
VPYIQPYAPEIKTLTAEFTRPGDTTAYAAGDAVGTATSAVLTLSNAGKSSGQGGKIRTVKLSKSTATVTAATFRVYFYSGTTAPAAIADNAAWTTLYADRAKFVGSVDLSTMISGGGAALIHAADVNITYNGRHLYAVIVALGAYAPGNAETFSLAVTVERY